MADTDIGLDQLKITEEFSQDFQVSVSDTLERVQEVVNSVGSSIKLQTKYLQQTVNGTGTSGFAIFEVANGDMSFANLTVGRYYRLTFVFSVDAHGNSIDGIIINIWDGYDNAPRIARINIRDLAVGSTKEFAGSLSTVFKSLNGNVRWSHENFDESDLLIGNGTKDQTYVVLEEMPFHTETTEW